MSRFLICLAVCIVLLAGCAKSPVEEKQRIFWPPLPDQPRLEWLGQYYSEDDFPKTNAEKMADQFLGKAYLTFMERPYGIANDPERNRVYVVDSIKKLVKIFDMTEKEIYTLGGDRPVVFNEPYGLAVDSAGRIFVADAGARAVRVFSPEGKGLFVLSSREKGFRPIDLAIDEALGRVYVSDGRNSKVAAFELSGGRFLFSFGGEGTGKGQLYAPQGLAINPDGHVFVAEMLNTRIQEFDADGNYVSSFGKRGDQVYHFEGPKDLAFDSDGNLHVLDVRKAALVIYQTDGTLLLFTGGSPTKNPLGFAMPVGLWIDKNDTIYISDAMNRRFSIWRYFSDEFIRQNPGEFATP